MAEEYIKVPKKRIGTIIGKNGRTKEEIEERLNVEVVVEDGTVRITEKAVGDPLAVWKAKDVVKAIARGFSPRRAFYLFKNGIIFETVDLKKYANTKKQLMRIKGRVIGKNGKTREHIEEMTGAYVSIYGKTISFIGEFEDVYDAKKAAEMILDGKPHSVAYKYLEKAKRKKKAKKVKLWKDEK